MRPADAQTPQTSKSGKTQTPRHGQIFPKHVIGIGPRSSEVRGGNAYLLSHVSMGASEKRAGADRSRATA